MPKDANSIIKKHNLLSQQFLVWFFLENHPLSFSLFLYTSIFSAVVPVPDFFRRSFQPSVPGGTLEHSPLDFQQKKSIRLLKKSGSVSPLSHRKSLVTLITSSNKVFLKVYTMYPEISQISLRIYCVYSMHIFLTFSPGELIGKCLLTILCFNIQVLHGVPRILRRILKGFKLSAAESFLRILVPTYYICSYCCDLWEHWPHPDGV